MTGTKYDLTMKKQQKIVVFKKDSLVKKAKTFSEIIHCQRFYQKDTHDNIVYAVMQNMSRYATAFDA